MSVRHTNSWPKLHNAMWPGLVGKGSPGAEPCIDLDTMLNLTAQAEVEGVRFDGVDLFLFEPHLSIDVEDDGIKRLAEKVQAKGFVVGSVVAPVWPPTGGGSAMGSEEDRARFVQQVRKACRIAQRLRELGVRPYGVVRIDSASGVEEWSRDPEGHQARIAETFRQACAVAEECGERLAAEGEICWGGMHSWKRMLELLERVDRPQTLGFQADMAHTLLYTLGYNAPEDALLPIAWDWSDPTRLDSALKTLTGKLRPWTIDFHVAQNDATVKGSGTHDKTGHHCLPNDPNGKLRIPQHAGYWLRGGDGQPTRAVRHVCWDGCMFPNEVMMRPETWNDILRTMIAVRDLHGWTEEKLETAPPKIQKAEVRTPSVKKPTSSRKAPRSGKTRKAKSPRAFQKPSALKTKARKAKRPIRKKGKLAATRPRRRPNTKTFMKKAKKAKTARKPAKKTAKKGSKK